MRAKLEIPDEVIAGFCRRHHIRRMSFFGSVLRDDFRCNSDVDVLVEFEPGKTPGFGFIDVENELSELLGRKVDLHTPGSLHPRILKRIETEGDMPTPPTDADRLYHILEAANEAVTLVAGKSKEQVNGDRVLVLALTRLIEIVGEAARNVDPALRERHPSIPWKRMVGTRDRLVHGYDRVDLDTLWDIITLELPPLVEGLQEIVGPLDG
jgi:uncharacterized protein